MEPRTGTHSASRIPVILVVVVVLARHRFGGNPISTVDPAREILKPAAFAAERPPCGVDWLTPAEYTQFYPCALGHPVLGAWIISGGSQVASLGCQSPVFLLQAVSAVHP